ncbi:tetratricopeptide repeat-containing protein, partial [Cystoisospora suis]
MTAMEAEGMSPLQRVTPTMEHDHSADRRVRSYRKKDSFISLQTCRDNEGWHGKQLFSSEELVLTNIQEMELRGLADSAAWLTGLLPRTAFPCHFSSSSLLRPAELDDLSPPALWLAIQLRPLLQRRAYAAAHHLIETSAGHPEIREALFQNPLLLFLRIYVALKNRALRAPGCLSALSSNKSLHGEADGLPTSESSSLMLDGLYTEHMDIPGLAGLAGELTAYLSSSRMHKPSSRRTSKLLRHCQHSCGGAPQEESESGVRTPESGHAKPQVPTEETGSINGCESRLRQMGDYDMQAVDCDGRTEDPGRIKDSTDHALERKNEASTGSQEKRAQSYIWWLLGIVKRAQGQGGGALLALLNSLRLNIFNMSCWHDLVSLILSMRFGDLQQDFPLPCFSGEDSHLWRSIMPSENRLDKGGDRTTQQEDEVVFDSNSQLDTSSGSSEVSVHSSDEGVSRGLGHSKGGEGEKKHRGGQEGDDTVVPPQDSFLLFQREKHRKCRGSLQRSTARRKTAGNLFRCSLSGGSPSRRACGDEGGGEDAFSDFEEDEELVYALEEASGGKKFLQEEKAARAWIFAQLTATGSTRGSNEEFPFEFFLLSLRLPSHYMTRFGYALLCMHANRYAEAASHYRILSETFPRSPYIYAQLAKCSYETKSYSYSLKFFDILHSLSPYSLDYVEDLSHIYFMRKQREELGELVKKCYAVDPESSQTLCVLGNFLSAHGDHPSAVRAFKRATLLAPNRVSLWVALGHAYTESRNVLEALQAYESATEVNPADCRGWTGLGQLYALLDNLPMAIHFFQKACDTRPTEPRLWTHLGDVLTKAGRDEESLHAFEKAWLLSPQYDTALRLFHGYQIRDGRWGLGMSEETARWAFQLVDRYFVKALLHGGKERETHLQSSENSDALDAFRLPWDAFFSKTHQPPPSSSFSSSSSSGKLQYVKRLADCLRYDKEDTPLGDVFDALLYLSKVSKFH